MYTRLPTAKELEASGLTLEDYEADEVEVWPENYAAFGLFCDMETQWRYASGGMGASATGLDYNVLFAFMARMRLPDDEYDDLLRDVRALETAALKAMSEK